MKGKQGQYPYDQYYIYVVFHKKEQRKYAILYPIDKSTSLKRTSISYARYLMATHLGRVLLPTEQVDHIDNNKQNDEITNLQILTLRQNVDKECKHRKQTVGTLMVRLKCPICHKEFIRRKGLTHLTKNRGNFTACSRSCSSKFKRIINKQILTNDEIQQMYKDNVIEIFRDKTN